MVLKMIGTMGTAGGSGHVLEYCGEAIRALSMEGRMTICNMSIEAGARAGMIAPDDTTFDYITSGNVPMHRPAMPWTTRWPTGAACPAMRMPEIRSDPDHRHRPHRAAGHLGDQPRNGGGCGPAGARPG
jgi:hypothetical protein